jgi:AcrR family transcriptional regulator
VLAAAMALHEEQGVLATSWEDIAGRAGVDVGTVSRWFPAVEDLVPACGGIKLRGLGIPAPADAAERFAGLDAPARARRLVHELFAIYERGELSFAAVPREAERLPVLARSQEAVERALDEFVAAALGADRRDASMVAAVRALTAFEVWSGLRGRGTAGDDAVSVVAAAVGAAIDVTAPARP